MLTSIYEIFLVGWEIFCCVLFMGAFAKARTRINEVWKYFIFAVMIAVFYVIAGFFAEWFLLKECLIIIAGTIGMYLCFQVQFGRCVILYLLFQGCGIVVDYITFLGLSKIFALSLDILNVPLVSILVSAVSKILLLCFVLSVRKKFGRKDTDAMTGNDWVQFAVFPVFTIFTIIAIIMNWELTQSSRQSNILICISLGMLLMNGLVFFMIDGILKREMQIREDKLYKERVRNETDTYRSISEHYEEQRKQVHEFKNHMTCIVELSQEGHYEELKQYLKKFDNEMRSNTDMIDTNHVIVNAILNSKYREGIARGIVFVIRVDDLSDIALEDEDLVIILSNLLNNAVEACEHCSKKVIKVKFVQEESSTILSVVNSVGIKPKLSDGKYQTIKAMPEHHGMGIENVITVVEKYRGKYTIDVDEEWFKFAIMLPRR